MKHEENIYSHKVGSPTIQTVWITYISQNVQVKYLQAVMDFLCHHLLSAAVNSCHPLSSRKQIYY
jgi:hypothetical protein